MELDVRRLKVLREVALLGTIAAAADSLGFTPSAISQQVAALQRELGVVLVERSGRGVRLTRDGQVLVARTEAVLRALDEAGAALEQSRGTISGELRIAASGSVAEYFVIPVIAGLARTYLQLNVALLQYEPQDSVRELRLGDLDVVVAHDYEHDAQTTDADIMRVDLFTEDMHVVAPEDRF